MSMILKAKINSKYLDEILSGKKKMEFRQFSGNDKMELTDENGRTKMVRIVTALEASKEMDAAVKMHHKEIDWAKEDAIIVFHVEPIKEPDVSSRGLV